MRTKKMRFWGLFLTVSMLLAMFSSNAFAAEATASPENLITNPGFEDGLEGWAKGIGVSLETEISHSGNNSAKVNIPTDSSTKASGIIHSNIPVTTGKTYSLSFWYKSMTDIDISGTLRLFFPPSTSMPTDIPLTESNKWTFVQKTVTADKEDIISTAVGISIIDFIGSVYIDDVSLTKTDGNELQNSGFENGLNNWDVVNPGGMQIAATGLQAQAGTSSLLIGGKQTAFNSYVNQSLAIAGSGYYTLSGSAKAAYSFSGSGVVMKLEAVNEAGQVIASAQAQSGTGIVNGWGAFDCKLLVPDGAVKLNVKIGSLNSDCIFLVDNIHLQRVGDVPPDNLLANNSFESDLTGWDSYGSPYAYSTTSQFHTGTKAISMGYFANEGLNKYIAQTYDVIIQGKVNFSVWVKTDANLTGAGAALFIDAVDANGIVLKTVTSQTVSNTNGAWQQVSVSMDMPAGTKQITAKIAGIYCTGVFYVDDAVLAYVN